MNYLLTTALVFLIAIYPIHASFFSDNIKMCSGNEETSVTIDFQTNQSKKSSIIGTWKDNGTMIKEFLKNNSGFHDSEIFLKFLNNKMTYQISSNMFHEGLDMSFTMDLDFNYTLTNNTIDMQYLHCKLISFDLKITPEMENMIKAKGVSRDAIFDMLNQNAKQALESSIDKEMKTQNKDKMFIVKLTTHELTLQDHNGKNLTYTRIK